MMLCEQKLASSTTSIAMNILNGFFHKEKLAVLK